ncbi:cbb3-type cytochrome oxidase assembly protein CcoS [Bacteriovorax sp. Seq25_V]|uniref:cbb3-type cytochrome oxidase assembly protein CcoS n=1 Tax=Bacteriovorax sp. Seq25_V TaxID=1201288 RepID=UPI00038A1C18|nr:cbb3-type cytochrome oxidase assembly protein CcoS [Bacteriovorax sp. Seq25_V]EQC43771.1 cytochrome oxidase maturation protein, cbb3-type [Bacteriovorax sp. Seq25_V]
MNVIYFMLPLALILGALFVGLFVWATKSGQYDDLDTPAKRMLFDDDKLETKRKGDL